MKDALHGDSQLMVVSIYGSSVSGSDFLDARPLVRTWSGSPS